MRSSVTGGRKSYRTHESHKPPTEFARRKPISRRPRQESLREFVQCERSQWNRGNQGGCAADPSGAGAARKALIASESATRQKLEQVVADEERYRGQLGSRDADLSATEAQLASRQADLVRAHARLASSKSELEAQKRQHAVLDSQELLLHADLNAKRASLMLSQTNLGYNANRRP